MRWGGDGTAHDQPPVILMTGPIATSQTSLESALI
jgi:hypothetical protein